MAAPLGKINKILVFLFAVLAIAKVLIEIQVQKAKEMNIYLFFTGFALLIICTIGFLIFGRIRFRIYEGIISVTVGVLLFVVTVPALMKILHLPFAGPLTILRYPVSVLCIALLLYIANFRKSMYVPLLLSILVIFLGEMNIHIAWPFGSLEALAGYICLLFFYLIRFLKKPEKNIIDGLKLIVVILICLLSAGADVHRVPSGFSAFHNSYLLQTLVVSAFILYIYTLMQKDLLQSEWRAVKPEIPN
jgi:hypothetical protein